MARVTFTGRQFSMWPERGPGHLFIVAETLHGTLYHSRWHAGVLAVLGLVRPSERLTWVLFKAASIYMLLSFLLITFGVIL